MGTTSPDIKVAPSSGESPEVKPEKKAENVTAKNKEAEKKLKTVAPNPAPAPAPAPAPKEEKPKWNFNTLGTTSGGDEKLNISTTGPTLTSPSGDTQISVGHTTSSERPDSGMRTENKNGIGFNVSTTPEAIGRGLTATKNFFREKIFKRKK